MTTGKTIALTKNTFVAKVMSLLFNMLSQLVIAFLPRSKCLLISRLQSPSALIFEPKKIAEKHKLITGRHVIRNSEREVVEGKKRVSAIL